MDSQDNSLRNLTGGQSEVNETDSYSPFKTGCVSLLTRRGHDVIDILPARSSHCFAFIEGADVFSTEPTSLRREQTSRCGGESVPFRSSSDASSCIARMSCLQLRIVVSRTFLLGVHLLVQ